MLGDVVETATFGKTKLKNLDKTEEDLKETKIEEIHIKNLKAKKTDL